MILLPLLLPQIKGNSKNISRCFFPVIMEKQPQVTTDARMKWDEFSRIGLPIWREHALSTSKAVLRDEIVREINFHDETQLRSCVIEQTFNEIPVVAHVSATFDKTSPDEKIFTCERIPNSPPVLNWGFKAQILIPNRNDFPDGGCCTLISAESHNEHKIFSCNQSLQGRIQANPYLADALQVIGYRDVFQMINSSKEDSFVYLEGRPKRYRRYTLTVDSCDFCRNDSLLSPQPPPVTLDLLSAYFTIFKEVLSEMNILGIKYRSVSSEPLTFSRNEESKI
jgi:hypothetical protein